jgi:CheY-like chemotaxis protein
MQKKLVIVEDRPEIVTLIKASFKGTDFETYDAANGDDGIALVEKEMPDLVTLDIMMPGNKSGLDVCSYLKTNPKTAHIKIIMISARSQATDIASIKASGADAILPKPFSPAALKKKALALVDKS